MTRYAKLTSWLIGVWFVLALTLSALHVLDSGQNRPPLPLGLAALTPVVVFLVWFAGSAGFRAFVLSLSPRALTVVQSWRVAGFAFVSLAAYGILPKAFGLPAGYGDMAIGLTAPLVALGLASPEHRGSFLIWQALGMLDLVMAVSLGTLGSVIDPHGIPTSAMMVLPLSMIPAFAVPLLLILHIACVAQALRWRQRAAQPSGTPVVVPVV
ncbi:MAG TPA: hypothetical protein VFE06_01420 [Acidobacteriaceae bacterium]|jgi:hypothetical protein|nr:hypothetical protein [Acidobacteriaceae bacterium]